MISDGSPNTEWALELPPSKRLGWGVLHPALEMTVEMPLGSRPINVVAVQSSATAPQEIFQSIRLLGSADKQSWEQVSFLVRPAIPHPAQWTTWEFDNAKFFPYLKLVLAPTEEQSVIRLAEVKLVSA